MAGESPDKSEQRKSSGETTPGERDPRLAVFRQASPGATAPQVDQATAVFKLPAERTASEPEAEPGTESGSVENDARLRAAVAAWVAGDGDDAPDADAQAAPAADADDADADETPVAEDADDAPDADAQAAPAADADDADADETPVAEDADAEVSDADEAPARDDAEEDKAPVAADADEEAPLVAEDADVDVPDAEEREEAPEGDEDASADAKSTPAEPEPEPEQEAADEADASPDVQPEADADPEPEAEPEPEADAVKPDTKPSDEGKDEGEGKGEATPPPTESAEANALAKPPVDQATAVFKTPRRPAVDQPTTALKVSPAPRPEAPAERSSTFVPLRTEDVRTPRAPSKPDAGASESAPASLTEAERTKQQPMPPLPPLDLLAELTNTPPPPQTPVRTVMRRIKIWTPLVVLLLIIFAVVQAFRPLPDPKLSLSAEPAFTFKGGKLNMPWPGEGQGAVEVEGVGSIGTYGAQKPAPIASVAKTMTAYVILQEHPISGKQVGEKITVDQQAEDESKIEDESTAQVSKGQQFTEKQMLQLLMIPSGNNAARLLARWDSKSEAEFVKKMNDAAKKLGMTNSTYTDPSGLKATTVSTPQDQLKLARAVLQNDIFRDIVNTPNITIPGIEGRIENNNTILLEPGVSGIKTGSSTPAGGNLLWTANTIVDGKNRRIVGAVMGAQNAALLHEKLTLAVKTYSLQLIKAAQEGVTSATVIKKGEVVGHIENGLGGRVAVVATKDLKAVGWAGLQVQIAIDDAGNKIPHSAKAGTVVGQVSVGSGTGKVTAPVALQQDLAEPGFGDKLTRLG
ncbi:D-alanyl-D-alanine carboxypeptidase family protein [Streptomyces sp. NBC_01481]|uniref:D-alanyl-D-alanine carboxypeptidase family protein n=1 Tax=Streptomyces sp. NBC_01481 TaxID=2975869 RepID=UPI0022554FE7|nr:serine hydrolase [Streptomyces sp. NBC_01481]MCX4588106.1 serine hydrolase [Streptomyces sp. NBC_01481]